MKKPSFQFYPGDWRKDPDLSRASLEAKGAMIEIMCLAFESKQRGVLITDKIPWSIEEIAFAIGGDKIKNVSAINELLDKKILKKNKKGAIFSKRMVKDECLSKVRRAAGSKGGNPVLVNQKVNQMSNQNPTPSSSTSSSTSVIKEKIEKEISREDWETEKQNFLNAGDWIFKFCRDKDISSGQFNEAASVFISEIELKEAYKDVKALKNYFVNWWDKKGKTSLKPVKKMVI